MELIQKYDYKRLYYSSDIDGLLGNSIFEVDESVRKYIAKCLVKLSEESAVVERVVRSISGGLELQLSTKGCFILDLRHCLVYYVFMA
jgi:hypothetical protein